MASQVKATRYLRKMRGEAQAHLLQGHDGFNYVVKFTNNPQHRRVLINEWLGCHLMRLLGLSCPETRLIEVSTAFLSENPEIGIKIRDKNNPIEPGLHFGSRYPAGQVAVYDFLPSSLLQQVRNFREVFGLLAFDKWVANLDNRQAIFFRPASEWQRDFLVRWIDNGFICGGPEWNLRSVGITAGLYLDRSVYAGVSSWDSFEPWLSLIRSISEAELWHAIADLPSAWLADDRRTLMGVIEVLMRRRSRVPDLLEDLRAARPELFPNWQTVALRRTDAGSHFPKLVEQASHLRI